MAGGAGLGILAADSRSCLVPLANCLTSLNFSVLHVECKGWKGELAFHHAGTHKSSAGPCYTCVYTISSESLTEIERVRDIPQRKVF